MYTSSRHVPGVGFAGLVHPGLIGCLPDPKLLELWNERETAFIAANPDHPTGVANPPFAADRAHGQAQGRGQGRRPPRPAHAPCRRASTAATWTSRTCRAARRSISPSTYPVARPLDGRPALFSQGDGEITFCGAIEMAGWLHLKVDVIKDGMKKYGIKSPIFKPSPIKPNYTDYLIFDGISVDEMGKQYYLDVGVAYRQGVPRGDRVSEEGFGYSASRPIRSSAPRRCRATSPASSTCRMPARRCGFRPRFSTSTSTPAWPGPRNSSTAASSCRWRRTCRSRHADLRIRLRRLRSVHGVPGRWRTTTSRRRATPAGRRRPGRSSRRPALAMMESGARKGLATNERSRHEPRRSAGAHPSGCGCCGPSKRMTAASGAAKSFPNARPWMISH